MLGSVDRGHALVLASLLRVCERYDRRERGTVRGGAVAGCWRCRFGRDRTTLTDRDAAAAAVAGPGIW